MKRQIKFRAWSEQDQKMYEFDLYNYMSLNEDAQEDLCPCNTRSVAADLMQYTGLKDRLGKEIYEGDIIETENGDKRTIVYFDNGFEMRTTKGTRENNMTWYFRVTVIGNIYESPSLLPTTDKK